MLEPLEDADRFRVDYLDADGHYRHDTTPEHWPDLDSARAAAKKLRAEHPGVGCRVVRLSTSVVEEVPPGERTEPDGRR